MKKYRNKISIARYKFEWLCDYVWNSFIPNYDIKNLLKWDIGTRRDLFVLNNKNTYQND